MALPKRRVATTRRSPHDRVAESIERSGGGSAGLARPKAQPPGRPRGLGLGLEDRDHVAAPTPGFAERLVPVIVDDAEERPDLLGELKALLVDGPWALVYLEEWEDMQVIRRATPDEAIEYLRAEVLREHPARGFLFFGEGAAR
jgi:hypothetical protein